MCTVEMNIKNSLAAHPFFEGLTPYYMEMLSEHAQVQEFQPGDFLLLECEEALRFYVILEVQVAVKSCTELGAPVTIQRLGPGEILGWSWLIPPHHWRFDARAVLPTRAIVLDGAFLQERCEADHELGYELLRRFAFVLAQRLEVTRIKLAQG